MKKKESIVSRCLELSVADLSVIIDRLVTHDPKNLEFVEMMLGDWSRISDHESRYQKEIEKLFWNASGNLKTPSDSALQMTLNHVRAFPEIKTRMRLLIRLVDEISHVLEISGSRNENYFSCLAIALESIHYLNLAELEHQNVLKRIYARELDEDLRNEHGIDFIIKERFTNIPECW